MTYVIGGLLFLAGFVALCLYPVNRVGVPLLVIGAVVIVLRVAGAIAADLPVPPKGISIKQMRAAIADQERRKRATPKQFEDMLSSPIGKGRLE